MVGKLPHKEMVASRSGNQIFIRRVGDAITLVFVNKIFAIVLLVFPVETCADVSNATLCFSSGGSKSVNFEMRTYYDSSAKFSSGFVKYQNSKQMLPLVLFGSISEALDKDAPDQETRTWLEVLGSDW